MSETTMATVSQKMVRIIMVVLARITTVPPALTTIPIVVRMLETQKSKAEPITTPLEVRAIITLRRLRQQPTLTQMVKNMCMRIDCVVVLAAMTVVDLPVS
jgi:hypothetical protein